MDTYTYESLQTARYLASQGVPIFLAWPTTEGEFNFPRRWYDTEPDPAVLDDWRPGMAVCAVMGRVVDGLDIDTEKGGQVPPDLMPVSYGRQRTPSGGTHDLIAPLGTKSKDGILPGVDLKAHHGMLYIAPTERKGGRYTWEQQPDLGLLDLPDDSGRALAQLVDPPVQSSPSKGYSGPEYQDLPDYLQEMASATLATKLDQWQQVLDQAQYWPEGYADHKGRGWWKLVGDFAWMLAQQAATPWVPMDEAQAEQTFHRMLPEPMANLPKVKSNWNHGIVQRAYDSGEQDAPPWDGNQVQHVLEADFPEDFLDSALTTWLADHGLQGRWVKFDGIGMHYWTGKVWEYRSAGALREAIRMVVSTLLLKVATQGGDDELVKQIRSMGSASRIKALAGMVEDYRLMSAHQMDSDPDLLNVGNGIVDLRTGQLLPHDRSRYMTKITPVDYIPGATSPDWDKVLTCLEPEVMDWMQIRYGQAITGHSTSDDVMIVGQGWGANGKTTLISTIQSSMGRYAVTVPERLLESHRGVPSEAMELLGARMAFIDETPEEAQLNMQLLKRVLGATRIKARYLHQNYIEWEPTHSLFVTTNHVPRVRETDHGTWRRLALVKFEKTYKPDGAFRDRMVRGEQGQREAALAWLVEGAKAWYANNMVIPPFPDKVAKDTAEWQGSEDLLGDFAAERLEFDPFRCIQTTELLQDLNQWLEQNGYKPWSAALMAQRIKSHPAFRQVSLNVGRHPEHDLDTKYSLDRPQGPFRAWQGIGWKK